MRLNDLIKLRRSFLVFILLLVINGLQAAYILIPMDNSQKNHLKAYGIAYWTLQRNVELSWLLNYRGDVFVHIGVVTDLSGSATGWLYPKFTWGSSVAAAKMHPAGENRWSFSIHNIRRYFEVPDDEKIMKIAVLFRSGNCRDSCYALRNEDGSDLFIPVNDVHVP